MTSKEIFETFNNFKTDMERWSWLMNNQDKGIVVKCDNDNTYIVVDGDDDDSASFRSYIGWDDGVFELLKAVGIKAESE
jgi:hypothetical protein